MKHRWHSEALDGYHQERQQRAPKVRAEQLRQAPIRLILLATSLGLWALILSAYRLIV